VSEVISHHDFSGNSVARAGGPRPWWPGPDGKLPEDGIDAGQAMIATAQAIANSPSEQIRQDLNLLYGSMYEGRPLTSLYQYGGQATQTDVTLTGSGAVTWNVTRSVVQTVASQVSRSRPRARFVTSQGDYKQRRKAKKLTQLNDGLFNQCRVYEKTQQVFIDAGVFDVGAIEVARDGNVPKVSRVLACEVMVDANDGIYGEQRSMYRRRYVDRTVLLAKYGRLASGKGVDKAFADVKEGSKEAMTMAIAEASTSTPVHDGAMTNLVEVFEAWHLRSTKEKHDGYHVIAIEGHGGKLVAEEYERDYFPIILFPMDPALTGPYGVCAAAQLMQIQMQINTLLDKIAKAQHLACVPRVGIPMSAKLGTVNNAIGAHYRFSGTQGAIFSSPAALSPEVYEHLERHMEKAFSLYGVNAQIAAGQKEAGLTAAVAIRESLDIQTARFAVLSQRWEQLHMDIARRLTDLAREIYEDDKSAMVAAPGTQFLETISWKDVDLEEDEYVLQPYPVSLLPTTPQGKIDKIGDLVDRGIWSAKRAESALDDLDPDAEMSAERAMEDDIERMCDQMLTDGEYETPDPTMDLPQCLLTASTYLALGRKTKAPEKNLDMLYRFLDDVAELQKQLAPAAPPAPAPAATGTVPAQAEPMPPAA
jgi:hypothetical protein